MLDEIRSFFEEQRTPFKWPEGLPAVVAGSDMRAESEKHWRLAMHYLDELEAKIVDLYDAGADIPAAIDIVDEIVAIIRRKSVPQDQRVREIGQLMRKRALRA
jgi:hypothetical protein